MKDNIISFFSALGLLTIFLIVKDYLYFITNKKLMEIVEYDVNFPLFTIIFAIISVVCYAYLFNFYIKTNKTK